MRYQVSLLGRFINFKVHVLDSSRFFKYRGLPAFSGLDTGAQCAGVRAVTTERDKEGNADK